MSQLGGGPASPFSIVVDAVRTGHKRSLEQGDAAGDGYESLLWEYSPQVRVAHEVMLRAACAIACCVLLCLRSSAQYCMPRLQTPFLSSQHVTAPPDSA